jgi:peptide/nickel transport system substrate-binding protein
MVLPSGSATARQEGELVQAMMQQIGVKVELRTVPGDDLFDKYVIPGDFDIAPFSWLGTPFPVSAERSIFALPSGGDIHQNYARVGSGQIDTLLDRAMAAPDQGSAVRLTNEADRLVWQEAAVIPLYQRPQLVAVRSGLVNFGARGFHDLAYEDIGFTPQP